MRVLLVVLATTPRALAASVRWPPQLNEQNATFVVRGQAVSVVSPSGCFSVNGRRCAAIEPSAGDDDGGAIIPSVAVVPTRVAAIDADLLVVTMEANCAGQVGLWHFLIKCVSTLVEDFRSATGALPGQAPRGRRRALLRDADQFTERGRPLVFARYTKGYYGKIFLQRGPRKHRSVVDAAQAARTVRCVSEAAEGPRARKPSCDDRIK